MLYATLRYDIGQLHRMVFWWNSKTGSRAHKNRHSEAWSLLVVALVGVNSQNLLEFGQIKMEQKKNSSVEPLPLTIRGLSFLFVLQESSHSWSLLRNQNLKLKYF